MCQSSKQAKCLCLPVSDIDEEECSTNRRCEAKAITSMRERIDNGNVSYSILSKTFEKESIDSCQTLYKVLIKVVLLQKEIVNAQSIYPDPPSKTLKNSLDVQLHSNMKNHIEFIVPLCLRSIVLRHCNHTSGLAKKVLMEKCEFELIEAFTRHLVHSLIFICKESTVELDRREISLQNALQSSQVVLDFIVGLSSIIQAKQAEVLASLYFQMLRDHETVSLKELTQIEKSVLIDETCHQIKCSQLLRLLAAETLSTIPSFLALNVPMKYAMTKKSEIRKEATIWLTRYVGRIQVALPASENSNTTVTNGWLADLVIKECLKTCSATRHLVVNGSVALVEETVRKNKESLRLCPESTPGKVELEAFHCTAFHAISVVYELVVRRHSMDQRFQSESAQGRIVGLIAMTILNQTCENARWLTTLDCANQVRSTWLLCFIYVLQEAPESLVYDFIRTCFEIVRNFETNISNHMPN